MKPVAADVSYFVMKHSLRFFTHFFLTLTAVAYPILWLAEYPQALHTLPYLMAGLWLLKAWQAVGFTRLFAILMAAILGLIALTRTLETLYWYPVIINGVMLTVFGTSLFGQQSFIERLARLSTPNLPPQAIPYTRRVTQIWCGFFLFNILLLTSLILNEQYQYWALYSGIIAYIIMGILLVGERIIRQWFTHR